MGIVKAIRNDPEYQRNVLTAETLCKLAMTLRKGSNIIVQMNNCPTFAGISAACGGICPPSMDPLDCPSMKVVAALDKCLGFVSSYKFAEYGMLNDNCRPACPLPPPPLGSYEHCPHATEEEWNTQRRLYSVFASGATIAGVNILLPASAGIKSGVFDQFISKVEVDEDIVSGLVTQFSTDFVPMNGKLVKCKKELLII